MTLDQRATLAATIAWLQWERGPYIPKYPGHDPSRLIWQRFREAR